MKKETLVQMLSDVCARQFGCKLEEATEKQAYKVVCTVAREMLAEVLSLAPQEIAFTCTENGKPLTDGAFFSVSHSGDVVACAVSDREVGLDLERIRPVPTRLGRALEGWQTPEEFWRMWVCREAAIKCRGGTLARWRREDAADLVFSDPAAPEGYVAAICEKK